MALTYIYNIQGWSSDLTTAVLVDETIYGGSNPARDTLANYIYFYKRDALNNDVAIVIDNTQPLTVNQYDFALPNADGLFVGQVFSFNIWEVGTYPQNDCVFYEGDSSYYIANTPTSQTPGGSEWDLITDVAGQVTGNTSVQQGQFYAWSSIRSQSGPLGNAMADLGQKMKNGRCKSWEESGDVLNGAALIESAFTNFRAQNYTEAQEIIDFVQQQTSLTF